MSAGKGKGPLPIGSTHEAPAGPGAASGSATLDKLHSAGGGAGPATAVVPPPDDGAADRAERAERPDRPERAERRRPRRDKATAPDKPEVPAEDLNDWRWRLGAKARKSAAARAKADAASRQWEELVAAARRAGVPERMILAAAADAGVSPPSRT